MIKNIFHPGNYPQHISVALLILRLAVGAFMLTHGFGKFMALIGDAPIQFPDPIGIGAAGSLTMAVLAEVFCSILIIFGIGTRFTVIPLLFTMLVAAFIVHGNDPFGVREMALLYTTIYSVIAIAGAGKFSIDHLIYSKINR